MLSTTLCRHAPGRWNSRPLYDVTISVVGEPGDVERTTRRSLTRCPCNRSTVFPKKPVTTVTMSWSVAPRMSDHAYLQVPITEPRPLAHGHIHIHVRAQTLIHTQAHIVHSAYENELEADLVGENRADRSAYSHNNKARTILASLTTGRQQATSPQDDNTPGISKPHHGTTASLTTGRQQASPRDDNTPHHALSTTPHLSFQDQKPAK
jgi:hypothetical protein